MAQISHGSVCGHGFCTVRLTPIKRHLIFPRNIPYLYKKMKRKDDILRSKHKLPFGLSKINFF